MKTDYLGKQVADSVTGFIGIAICRLEHMGGIVEYVVQREMHDDAFLEDVETFFSSRLTLTSELVKQRTQ